MISNSNAATIRYGNFLFKYRNTVFPVVTLALFLAFRPGDPWGSVQLNFWLDVLGVSVAFLGQSLRVLVIGLAYIRRGGRQKKVHADRLVTDGIFSHCRNPLYIGNLLIVIGLFIIHNNPWVYLLGGAFFWSAYHAIVAAEESFLQSKFGDDYAAYCERVHRWMPKFHGLSNTIRGMGFNWRRVVAKDYSTAYVWMVMVVLLLAYETGLRSNWPENSTQFFYLGLVFVALTLTFLVAWRLKKTKRLGRTK